MADKTQDPFIKRSLLLFCLLVGIVLRLVGSFSDLWLDELWSLGYALEAQSISDIWFHLKIDNNHLFNTSYLYGIGSVSSPFLYRGLSFVSGVMLLLALYRESSREADSSWQLLLCLLCLNNLVILYASEARGYGLMAFCLVMSWLLLSRYHEHQRIHHAFGLWVYCILGLFSQFSFALFFLAAPLWSLSSLLKRLSFKKALYHLGILWSIPGMLSVFVYLSYIRHIPAGTGYLYASPFEVLLNSILLIFGFPSVSPYQPGLGALSLLFWLSVLFMSIRWIYQLYQIGDDRWTYFLSILCIVPVFVVFVLNPRIFCTRYIYVVVLSFIWLFSIMINHSLHERLPKHSLSLWTLLTLFLIGTAYSDLRFLLYKRGRPQAVFQQIDQMSTEAPVTIKADNDYRTLMMLAYHWPLVSKKQFHYLPRSETQQASWYLLQTRDRFTPREEKLCPIQECYCFHEAFPYTAESGWEWRIYQSC